MTIGESLGVRPAKRRLLGVLLFPNYFDDVYSLGADCMVTYV